MKTIDLSQFPELSKMEIVTAVKAAIYGGAFNECRTLRILANPETIDYVQSLFDADSNGVGLVCKGYEVSIKFPSYEEKEDLTKYVLDSMFRHKMEELATKYVDAQCKVLDAMAKKKRWYQFWK